MSGHSKWKQIKHKKAATDAKRGQLFSKIVREIMIAVRAGGSAEATNLRLKAALTKARDAGLPKENTERAIERASGNGEGSKLQEFLYEAAAPHGAIVLIEGITDNKNRSLAEIKKILTDTGARLADPGSLVWNFEKIGVVVSASLAVAKNPEEAELSLIDSGAKDFTSLDDQLIIETTYGEQENVRAALEACGIPPKDVGYDYKPKLPIELTREDSPVLERLVEALENRDDVQNVYTNIKSL